PDRVDALVWALTDLMIDRAAPAIRQLQFGQGHGMRILETLAGLWPRSRTPVAADEAKASATGPLIVLETLGRPVWTPRDYETFAREGFMQNAIVYRAVRMIAEAAASVPLMLFEGDQEHDDHPLLDLLARPSLDHTGADFL